MIIPRVSSAFSTICLPLAGFGALAENAITQAVRDGFAELGVSLFRGFAKERAALGLDSQTLEIVGNVRLKQGVLLDAGWCLFESANAVGDAIKAQKKLLHVASVAEETGKYVEAAKGP